MPWTSPTRCGLSGAGIVGPVNSLGEAHALAKSALLHAAILDVQLAHTDISVIPATLSERAIPLLFCSGFGGHALRRRWTDAIWLNKPSRSDDVVAAMQSLLQENGKKARFE